MMKSYRNFRSHYPIVNPKCTFGTEDDYYNDLIDRLESGDT